MNTDSFNDWFYNQFDRPEEAAKEAWEYQQQRIDELEAWIVENYQSHPNAKARNSAEKILARMCDNAN